MRHQPAIHAHAEPVGSSLARRCHHTVVLPHGLAEARAAPTTLVAGARYKMAVNQQKVEAFAREIVDAGFPRSHMEVRYVAF